MLLLFFGLLINGEIPKELEKLANRLLSHLPLLFIPVSVGIMRYFELIEKQVVLLFLAISMSTFLTYVVSGWIMESRLKK
jgi:holin-like protein